MTEEVKRPAIRDEHTAENTTMSAPGELKLGVEHKPEHPEDIALSIILGTRKETFEPTMRLVMLWSRYRVAADEGKVSKAEVKRLKLAYEEERDIQHPDKTNEELETMMGHFLSFNRNFVELGYFRNKAIKERNWENTSEIADGVFESDIVPRYPGAKNEAMAIRNRMVRSSQRRSRTPNGYDVLLRDSFIQVRIEPSDLLELGQMIDRINKEISGYVRSFNGNSLTLIRAAIYRVFWEYISEKIVNHSVSDVDEPAGLSRLIKLSDLRALFTAVLKHVQEQGVDLQVYCNQDGCDWYTFIKVDADLMLLHEKSLLKPEQAAALGNLKNFAKKYTSEEVIALQKQYEFVEDDTTSFLEDTHIVKFEQPSIAEYFIAYDVFMEYIGPAIRELRTANITDETFNSKLTVLIDTVRGLEYLHWASELTIKPEPGTDDTEVVFTREEDPIEFFNGLIEVINPSDEATSKVIRWAVEHGPAMSSTVVGMANAICPKCGKDTHGGHMSHGITPIDPFMSFFIQTRQAIQTRAINRAIIERDTI